MIGCKTLQLEAVSQMYVNFGKHQIPALNTYPSYYNPNTSARSTYNLEVELENNEVVKVYFANGGWLDSDHMSPEELDSKGHCTISSILHEVLLTE